MVHCLCVLVTQSCPTPWTVARQAPPFMESSRQEYWSGLPFPSPGDLPDPGIKPGFPTLQAESLPSEPEGKPFVHVDGVTQASSSMNFYPGDKFPHLGPLPWPYRSRPCVQACTRPDHGHPGLLQRPESHPSCPHFGLRGQGKVGFDLVEASPQKAGCRGRWVLHTSLQSVPGLRKHWGQTGWCSQAKHQHLVL